MLKKLSLLLLSSLLIVPVAAQNMHEVFKQMPASVYPYLSKTNRLDFLDFMDSKMKAEVNNDLGTKSEMMELTDDYTDIDLSGSSNLQLKLLPLDSIKVICMVTTCYGPEADSNIRFYDTKWNPLPIVVKMPSVDNFFQRPDTMSVQRFNELKKTVEPVMISGRLSSKNNSLTLSLSKPLLNKDEKKALDVVLRQVTLVWNGKTFQ